MDDVCNHLRFNHRGEKLLAFEQFQHLVIAYNIQLSFLCVISESLSTFNTAGSITGSPNRVGAPEI